MVMQWRSDWLYHLIFDEVVRLWAQAQREGTGTFGPAPDRFYIQQCAAIDWKHLFLQEPILRLWLFQGTLPPILVSAVPPPVLDQTVRGMFFVDGTVQFCITADRKRVIWNHWLGRRYGRGKVFRVVGQGLTAQLEKDPEFGEWVS